MFLEKKVTLNQTPTKAERYWMVLDKITDIVLWNIPGCVVEVGCGASSNVLGKHAHKMGRVFYSCDKSHKKLDYIVSHSPYKITPFYGSSLDFIQQFNESPAVVFIDGDHRAKILQQEVDFFLEKLAIGGVIMLHDTCPWDKTFETKTKQGKIIDTFTVRLNLEKNPNVDTFTWRYTAGQCGVTMVLKKDPAAPHYR